MNNQDFKVFGDKNLLKNCKINIFTIDETGLKKQNTLFNNGKLNKVESAIEIAEFYKIYISYQDSQINILEFENIYRSSNDQINHFYISKKDGEILISFVGTEAEIKKMQGLDAVLMPNDAYFKSQNITDEKLIQEEKQKFFNLYSK